MKELILNSWGKDRKITLGINTYMLNKTLCINMICYDDGYPEPYANLTVNLPGAIPKNENCAFVDTNNLCDNSGCFIIPWITENNLGKPTGRVVKSGFCVYPEYEFDLDEIRKYTAD